MKTLHAVTRHIPGWSRALGAARPCIRAARPSIPGFRSGNATARALAITYYAVALAVAIASWPWGVAMLCLPFLCFALVGLSHAMNRRVNLITIAVAGAVMLAMSAVVLGVDGYRPKAALPQPVALADVDATATLKPAAAPTAAAPTISASIAATPATATPSAAAATTAITTTAITTTAITTPAATRTDQPIALVYVASKNGKVFHLPTCSSAKNIKPENRLEFASREEAVEKGLSPCKRCKP